MVPASSDHRYLLPEQRERTPLVFVDRPARFINADSVTSDNVGGAEQAVSHLAASGHRRIGFLGDALEIQTAADRLQGYSVALAALGVDHDPAIVRTGLRSVDAAALAVTELLRAANPPTALFTAQNLVTVGALRALRDLGLEHRTALVGFDDIELADLLQPAVTVVAQDPAAMGALRQTFSSAVSTATTRLQSTSRSRSSSSPVGPARFLLPNERCLKRRIQEFSCGRRRAGPEPPRA